MENENTVGGSENLEVMREAKNYNAFLMDQVFSRMRDCVHILDFGAGNGLFAQAMKEQGHKVTCVEPEPALATALAEAGFKTYASLDEIEPNSLDGAYTLNVLEHIEDDRAVLSGLYDRIKPGGRLYIYVPAFQILFSSMDRRVGHVRRYRLNELVEKCRDVGFNVETGGYADSLGYLASLAYRLLGRDDGVLNSNTVRLYDKYIFPVSHVLDLLSSRFFGKNVWIQVSRSDT